MPRAERPQHENPAPRLAEGEHGGSQGDAQKQGGSSARTPPGTTSTEARLTAVSSQKTRPSLRVDLSLALRLDPPLMIKLHGGARNTPDVILCVSPPTA